MKRLKEQGITLVALVVTIIILLILSGVTLNIALSENGIFNKAKKATEKYQKAQTNEEELIIDLEQEIDTLSSEQKIPTEMQIGDVVHYITDTKETSYTLKSEKSGYDMDQIITKQTLEWKVLSKNNDSVDIIGIPTKGESFYFKGATGYNNGVYLLDEICEELYSNNKLGVKARSIDLQDIESKMNKKGKEDRDEYIQGVGQYGKTKDYLGDYAYYPNLAKYEEILGIDEDKINEKGIGESDDGTNLGDIEIPLVENDRNNYINSRTKANNNITVKMNYYKVSSKSEYFDDNNFYNLIFGSEEQYWIASRFSRCETDVVKFGIRLVNNSKLSGRDLFYSNDEALSPNGSRVCPIVSLKSNIEYTGSSSEGWNIK